MPINAPNPASLDSTINLHLCARSGNDAWTGNLSLYDSTILDGPMKTLHGAIERVRFLRRQGTAPLSVTIHLNAGYYFLSKPLTLGPEDHHITFQSMPNEEAIIGGGRRIEGWKEATLESGLKVFTLEASALFAAGQSPLSLYVHNQRAARPRWPQQGWSWMEAVPGLDLAKPFELFTSHQQFQYKQGDCNPGWRNLQEVDVIVSHFWVIERMPIAQCQPSQNLITCSKRSLFPLRDAWDSRFAKYYLENVFEGLSNPGEFYADRSEGRLYYVPREGECADQLEAIVPVARQLIRIEGTPSQPVRGIEFHGITFQHTEVQYADRIFNRSDPAEPSGYSARAHASSKHFLKQAFETPFDAPLATFPQAAANVSAAIRMEYAQGCVLDQCCVEHTGAYAVQLLEGARQCRIHACTLRDLGAGGILLDGGDLESPLADQNSNHLISHCRIYNAGHVFPAAVGIISMHSFRNVIAHNEIFDLSYSGISCGWVWGYDQNISRENRIEYNRIHQLGQRGGLSDMGGIYTLGVQPGTIIKGNVIHDVCAANYGAWCLYLDEGSSFITVEGNVCLGPASNSFFEHWGRQNIYRYNLFATEPVGKEDESAALVSETPSMNPESCGSLLGLSGECDNFRYVDYPARGVTITLNILLTSHQPIYSDNQRKFRQKDMSCSCNLLWDRQSKKSPEIYFYDNPWKHLLSKGEAHSVQSITLAEAQQHGLERHSLVLDPEILEMTPTLFRCAATSPIHELGIPLPRPELAGPQLMVKS